MLEPVSLRKPIPHSIVQALAVYGLVRGLSASKLSVACDWISFAVGWQSQTGVFRVWQNTLLAQFPMTKSQGRW